MHFSVYLQSPGGGSDHAHVICAVLSVPFLTAENTVIELRVALEVG